MQGDFRGFMCMNGLALTFAAVATLAAVGGGWAVQAYSFTFG